MMDKILVPLDGSREAEAVLPHVRRLARWNNAEILLLRVPEVPPVLEYAALYGGALETARAYLGKMQARLHADRFRIRTLARGEVATDTILEVAVEEQVSLIAMATHGRTGLSRMLFGSVAENVMKRTHIPMLLVRPGQTLVEPSDGETSPAWKILVPTDGSEASMAVMPAAAAVAKMTGATVRILRVLEPIQPPLPPGWAVSMAEDLSEHYPDRKEAEEDLEKAAALFHREDLRVESTVETGHAAEVIGDEARRGGVTLIAMATHGRTGLADLVTGSVTREVLQQADRPMLVVRAPKILSVDRRTKSHATS